MPYELTGKQEIDSLLMDLLLTKPDDLTQIVGALAQIEAEDFSSPGLIAAFSVACEAHPLSHELHSMLEKARMANSLNAGYVAFQEQRGIRLNRGMTTLKTEGYLDRETLQFLLEADNPEAAAILLGTAFQNKLQLTAEDKEVFKTCTVSKSYISSDFQSKNALESKNENELEDKLASGLKRIIEVIQERGLLTAENLVSLAKRKGDRLSALNRAIDILLPCDLLDNSLLEQILNPAYSWVCTALVDLGQGYLDMDKSVREGPFNLITSEFLYGLFKALKETPSRSASLGSKKDEASGFIRGAKRLTTRLTGLLAQANHLTANGISAALAAAQQTCTDKPLHVIEIDTITRWFANHNLLNEGNLNRLFGPAASESVYAVLRHRDVCAAVDRIPTDAFTQDVLDEVFDLAEGAATAKGQDVLIDANVIFVSAKAVAACIDEATGQFMARQQLAQGPGIDPQGVHDPVFEQSVGEAMKNLWRVWGGRFRERTEEKGKDYYWDEITAAVKAGQDRAISEQEEQEGKDWEKCSRAVEYLHNSGAADSRWDVKAGVSVSLDQLVGMAWSIIHDDQRRVAGVDLDQAKKRFLMTAFRDSAEAYGESGSMSCVGGFRNRVVQGLDGVISKDIVDLVLQTPTMAANRFPVLVREAVLEYFEQRPEPQTAEDYRTCKAALDELLAGSEIPEWVCQEIKASVREGMATQFSRLYEGPEGLAHLDELVGLMASVSMGPTKDEIQARLAAIQTRLESSQGAHLDREEQATPPTPTLKL